MRDPEHARLRAELEAEFARQAAATQYRIPEYAHKPGDALVKKQKAKKK